MYRALLICNSVFPADTARLRDLNGAARDGLELWAALTNSETGLFRPVDVTVLFERTATEIKAATEKFFREADDDDVLLFYYSGHGLQTFGHLVLSARDTNADLPRSTAVECSSLNFMITESSARAIVVLLDCCYSGAFGKGVGNAEFGRYLAGKGRFVLTAGSAVEEAGDADQALTPSPFTAALVEGLRPMPSGEAVDSFVVLDELYKHTVSRVPKRYPRPHRAFDGAGSLPLARRPRIDDVRTGHASPSLEAPNEPAGSRQASNLQTILRSHGRHRVRNDFSHGDLLIWRYYLLVALLLLAAAALSFRSDSPSYPDANANASELKLPALMIGAAMVLWSLADGVVTWRTLRVATTRRASMEALESLASRFVRGMRDLVAASAGCFFLYQLFVPYQDPVFALAGAAAAALALMSLVSQLRYSDAAYLVGIITVLGALFMPDEASTYGVTHSLSGTGLVQLLLGLAMAYAWWSEASASTMALLGALCAAAIVPAFQIWGDSNVGFELAGPGVGLFGAALAFIGALLGNGTAISDTDTARQRSLLGMGIRTLRTIYGLATKPADTEAAVHNPRGDG